MSELRALCVTPFPHSITRSVIMSGMETAIGRLESNGVQGDLWVDGSFVTSKQDPNDADLVLRFAATWYETASPPSQTAVQWFQANLKADYRCDSYAFPEWPTDHPRHAMGEWLHAYWLRQWGFSRSNEMKGIVVISIGGGFRA